MFELTPEEAHVLVVGAPLSLRVTAKRHGRFVEMDADLVDAAGRGYSPGPPDRGLAPPQFTVYKNDQALGSGSFEYG